ncbi:MAG: LicD family protein, partial [Syntrophobacteraceae bacterium]
MELIEATDAILQRTPPVVVGRLYRLLKIFSDVSAANRITFWLCEGSLLGAIRHGGIIPWDDDIDVAV